MVIFILTLCLKLIASEASEENFEKNERFGNQKIIGPRPLGGARAGCAPPGSASEIGGVNPTRALYVLVRTMFIVFNKFIFLNK